MTDRNDRLANFVIGATGPLARAVRMLREGKTDHARVIISEVAARCDELASELRADTSEHEHRLEALTRLISVANGGTGQSVPVTEFLLAFWNAGQHGGFDITDFWRVDGAIADDMLSVLALVAKRHEYPDVYGFRDDFERLAGRRATERASAARL